MPPPKQTTADKVITHANDITTPSMPTMGNGFTRWLGRTIMKSLGWTFKGKLPDERKVIFIGVPHTSNWDFIIAMASILAAGLKCHYMMKKEAFVWPLSGLWKALGGIPIERSKKTDITEQMTEWFNTTEKAWLGITPEGTRSKVDRYKTGYLRMAYAADASVFIIGMNGQTKEVTLDKVFPLTGDIETDNAAIKAYVDERYNGVKPENA